MPTVLYTGMVSNGIVRLVPTGSLVVMIFIREPTTTLKADNTNKPSSKKMGWAESMPDQEFTKVEVIKIGEKDKAEIREGCIIIRKQVPLPKH